MFDLRKYQKETGQRGVVIIALACMLPVMLGLTGLAVDVGNIYIHASRLQNAADAAALAGAQEYAKNKETISSHGSADLAAKKYADSNTSEAVLESASKYKAQEKNDTTYYGAKLAEDVPLYFFSFVQPSYRIEAKSCASINQGGGIITDMFIFEKSLSAVNSIQNPDNINTKGQITQTFDGSIVYTDGSGKDVAEQCTGKYSVAYSMQSNQAAGFYSAAAKSNNCSVKEANDNRYYTTEHYKAYDIQALGKTVSAMLNKVEAQSNQNVSTSDKTVFDTNALGVKFQYTKTPNVSIDVNANLPGTDSAALKDKPVYVYIDSGIGVVNLNMSADTGRPLVLCYMGTGQVHVSLNGHNYRGIIYAPNVCDEGILLNEGSGSLSGSIIAQSINLKCKGEYKYECFDEVHDGSSSGKNGAVIKLSNEQLDWNA